MSLSRRVGVAVTWAALVTGASVGIGVGLGFLLGWGLPGAGALGLAGLGVGSLVSHLVARQVVRPVVQRLSDLVEEVGKVGPTSGRVPELGDAAELPLGAAINGMIAELQARIGGAEADARLLASLVENSPNGLLICNADGRIRTVNQAFRDLFELRGDPVGRLPTEVLSVPEVHELVDLARSGQGDDEVRLVPGSRTVVLRPIATDGGEVGVLAQDITAFRAAERARTDFVANVSHELRTPMAAILGYAETLSQDLDRLPDDVVPLVEAVSRNSRRLRDTFEGLMRLAQVEARLGELALEPLRLQPLLAEAVAAAADEAATKGLDFALECPEDLTARINAEAFDLIIRNLATNAIKYTPTGGEVRVVALVCDEDVRVDIVDTGIGIEAAHQARVFERFFRVDEGRAREVGGTGLGLAMVRHLALATGARVSLASEVGEGSTFSLHLPPAAGVS